eukprot:780205_1
MSTSRSFPTSPFDEALKDEYGTRRTFSSFRNSTLTAADTGYCKCCNYLPLIHPYGPFRYFIDFIITIGLLYTCIEAPVTIAFHVDLELNSMIALCIDILLLFDILINFRTAYFDKYDRLRLVHDPYEIAKRYLLSWLCIDLISSLPFQLIAANDHDDRLLFGLLRCLKILRVIKIARIYNKFKKTIVSREMRSFIKLFNLLLSMLLFAHYAACFWYFIGYHNHEDTTWLDAKDLRDSNLSTFKLYSFAWYWAVVTLFTTGYGDITAQNTMEQWVSSILILIGTCFFSYFIGTLTVLITEGDKVKAFQLDRLGEAQNFCSKKKLPPELTRAILTHTRYHCENNFVFDEDTIVHTLPLHLQLQIEYYLSSRLLKQIRIFASLNDSILGQIALKIRSISCNATHTLYHKGERAKELYIQRTGLSELNCHDSRKENVTLERGHVFGEDAFVSPKRSTSVSCQTWCEFYVIPIADVIHILQNEYPKTYLKKVKKIIDAVRAQMQLQSKIDFKRYEHVQTNGHSKSQNEIDPLDTFLNQPATDLAMRYQFAAVKKKKPVANQTNLLKAWTSRFELFRNSSTLRDRIAHRQETKRQLSLNKTKSMSVTDDKKEKEQKERKKADDEHDAFYASWEHNTDVNDDTDEDIGDIVPGIRIELEPVTDSNSYSLHIKKSQYAATTHGHAHAQPKTFGIKGVRRKVIKTNDNTKHVEHAHTQPIKFGIKEVRRKGHDDVNLTIVQEERQNSHKEKDKDQINTDDILNCLT